MTLIAGKLYKIVNSEFYNYHINGGGLFYLEGIRPTLLTALNAELIFRSSEAERKW